MNVDWANVEFVVYIYVDLYGFVVVYSCNRWQEVVVYCQKAYEDLLEE